MESIKFGSRRAVLKASVAVLALAGAGSVLAACEEKPAEPTIAASTDPVATTTNGKIKGFLEGGVTVFKGVRYGADTATTRFQAPKAPEPWTGVKDALAYGASAPQAPAGDGGGLFLSWRPKPAPANSEDCLFLNVWTAGLDDKKRPVLVWFHGGGWGTGSGSSNAYDGVRLAKRDAVIVTVNHRLNAFGYMNLAGYGEKYADSGVAGVLDMVLALQWVRDNIAAFGGDPGNVLIFGQSGGGLKISTLMGMDAAKGLFHRAVVQSGAGLRLADKEASGKAAAEVVKKLGLDAATIDQIATRTVAEIQTAIEGVAGVGSPVMDGKNFTRHPFDPDGAPASVDVPLLIGVTRTEGTSLEGGRNKELFNITWDTLPKELQRALPGRNVKTIIDTYKKTQPNIEAPELYFGATSDNQFFRNSVTLADRKSKQGGAPVWFYELDWETPVMEGKRYVPHALDIGMIFDNVAKSESMSGTSPEAQAIADQMSSTWLAFAKTGNPANDKVPEWPVYTEASRNMMVFRAQPGVEVDIRAAERALVAPKA